jgi:hypothetical protein
MVSTSTSASGAPPKNSSSYSPGILLFSILAECAQPNPAHLHFTIKIFTKNLVLKTVERLPSLVQDLARNVDKSLNAALKTLPPLPGLLTTQEREDHIDGLENVRQESNFRLISANSFRATARALLRRSLYTLPPHSRDGNLSYHGHHQVVPQPMQSWTRSFPSLERATWEFKNLVAGSVEVLTAVPNLGRFSWTYCDPPNCPSHKKGRKMVKLSKVGPDAQAPPWSLPLCSYSLES